MKAKNILSVLLGAGLLLEGIYYGVRIWKEFASDCEDIDLCEGCEGCDGCIKETERQVRENDGDPVPVYDRGRHKPTACPHGPCQEMWDQEIAAEYDMPETEGVSA